MLDLRPDCLASLQKGYWRLCFLIVLVGIQSGRHLCCCQRRWFLMELIITKNQVIVVSPTKNTFNFKLFSWTFLMPHTIVARSAKYAWFSRCCLSRDHRGWVCWHFCVYYWDWDCCCFPWQIWCRGWSRVWRSISWSCCGLSLTTYTETQKMLLG